MKILLFVFIFSTILFSCTEHFYLESKDGNFSVNFPGKPIENKLKLPTADGDYLEINSLSYLSPDSSVIYVLSHNSIPNYVSANPDSILQNAKIGPAQNMRTSIVEEKKLNLQGFPGLYFKGLGLDIAMVYHIYIVKDKMYQLAIINNIPREPEEGEIKAFMGSFKLLQKP
jgi:hypothetical protein